MEKRKENGVGHHPEPKVSLWEVLWGRGVRTAWPSLPSATTSEALLASLRAHFISYFIVLIFLSSLSPPSASTMGVLQGLCGHP